jgi:hypothetical protein
MKNPVLIAVVALILGGGIAAYFYWQQGQSKPEPVPLQSALPPPPPVVPPSPPKPEVHQVVETPPASPPLPALADSDSFVFAALDQLVGNKSLMKFFHGEKIIHNIVATIDNLPTGRVPMRVMPVKQVPGSFIVSGSEDDLVIGDRNTSRYTPYVRIAEAIDAKKLVQLYVHLYPLFQQAYEKLGYPKKYFNDRLILAIDDLLSAPVIKGPVKLVQPNVLYQFADPELEERSIGQKILMRTGSRNESIIKSRLRAIKQELLLHMHEKKIVKTD